MSLTPTEIEAYKKLPLRFYRDTDREQPPEDTIYDEVVFLLREQTNKNRHIPSPKIYDKVVYELHRLVKELDLSPEQCDRLTVMLRELIDDAESVGPKQEYFEHLLEVVCESRHLKFLAWV